MYDEKFMRRAIELSATALEKPGARPYGAEGKPPIPPGAVLIFRIQLIDFLPAPGTVQQG